MSVIFDSFGTSDTFSADFDLPGVAGPPSGGLNAFCYQFVTTSTEVLYVNSISVAVDRVRARDYWEPVRTMAFAVTPAIPGVGRKVAAALTILVPDLPGQTPQVVRETPGWCGPVAPGAAYWLVLFAHPLAPVKAYLNSVGLTGPRVQFLDGQPQSPATAPLPAFRVEGTTSRTNQTFPDDYYV